MERGAAFTEKVERCVSGYEKEPNIMKQAKTKTNKLITMVLAGIMTTGIAMTAFSVDAEAAGMSRTQYESSYRDYDRKRDDEYEAREKARRDRERERAEEARRDAEEARRDREVRKSSQENDDYDADGNYRKGHSQGEVNTAAIVGAVVGVLLGRAL